jgi:2-polyprenyl-3-methyl-5-hydroxy-6-metoxy-1,4-benzoquinol methylase
MGHYDSDVDGDIAGNLEQKGESTGIGGLLVKKFDDAFLQLVAGIKPGSLADFGCGEGRMSRLVKERSDIPILAYDAGRELIQANLRRNDSGIRYQDVSIYDIDPDEVKVDLIICLEVLEHLETPSKALAKIRDCEPKDIIVSVPNEPLWRFLNMCRFKYISSLGNTPGHINHWSSNGFQRLLRDNGFEVVSKLKPIPWIILHCKPS